MIEKTRSRNLRTHILRRPRWFHRVWAWLFGYFWLPCPDCGRMFGGHESAATTDGPRLLLPGRDDKMACPPCEFRRAQADAAYIADYIGEWNPW